MSVITGFLLGCFYHILVSYCFLFNTKKPRDWLSCVFLTLPGFPCGYSPLDFFGEPFEPKKTIEDGPDRSML